MRLLQNFGFGLIVAVALMAGCKKSPSTPPITGAMGTEAVEILNAISASDAVFADVGSTLINEKADKYAGVDAALSPDYDTQTVVVVSLGQVTTGGYGVKITGAQRKGHHLFLQFTTSQPGPDDVVTQAIEHPYAAILIPKFTGTVHLEPQD